MSPVMTAWLALFCSLATGAAWVSVLWRCPRPTFHERCVRAAVSVAIGLSISAAVQFAYLVLGRIQPHAFLFADTAMLAVALAFRSRQRRNERRAAKVKGRTTEQRENETPDVPLESPPEALPRASPGVNVLPWTLRVLPSIVAGLAVAAGLVAVGERLRKLPMGEYDAVSMWNVRARFLLRAGEHWRDAFATAVHADYPLTLQLNIARLWRYLGEESPIVPQGLALLFTAGTLAVLHGTAAALRGRTLAAGAVAAVVGASLFLDIASLQYADVPFGFFVTCTTCLLALSAARGGHTGVLALAGACAGGAMFTKNEGSPVLLAGLVAVALFPPPSPVAVPAAQPAKSSGWRARASSSIVFLLGAAPLAGVRLWQKHELPAENDLIEGQSALESLARLVAPSRHVEILRAVGRLLLTPREYSTLAGCVGYAVPPMFLVAAALLGRAREPALAPALRRVALVCATIAGVYYTVYLLTPHNLYWHLETSLQRLYIHVLPSLALLIALATRKPEDALAPPV